MLKALRFLVLTAAIALVLSLVAWPLQSIADLSWWRIFRRCASISAVFAILLSLRWDGLSFKDIGLGRWSVGKTAFLKGILYGLAGLCVILLIQLLFDACTIQIHTDKMKVWRTLLLFIPGAIMVAWIEEVVFRGYIFFVLRKLSNVSAVLMSSAAYAMVHLKSGDNIEMLGSELVGLFILGIVLVMAAIWSRNLYLPIGLHAVLAYGARVNKLVIAIPDSEWMWFFGTSRLINGVLSWSVLALVAALLFYDYKVQHGAEQTEEYDA